MCCRALSAQYRVSVSQFTLIPANTSKHNVAWLMQLLEKTTNPICINHIPRFLHPQMSSEPREQIYNSGPRERKVRKSFWRTKPHLLLNQKVTFQRIWNELRNRGLRLCVRYDSVISGRTTNHMFRAQRMTIWNVCMANTFYDETIRKYVHALRNVRCALLATPIWMLWVNDTRGGEC